jgi:hypothetical protein
MTKANFAAVIGMALLFGTVGCETTTNTNNANLRNANGNVAVVTNTNTAAARDADDDDDWDPDITRADYEKGKDRYEREAKETGSTIGQGADDLWLWTKTRSSLLGADDLRDSTINVDVDNNVVTLKGSVATAAQKTKAEQVAKGIEGVKSVRNQLTVAPAGATNTNAARNTNARS